ncbi:MAG: hypothetical protein IH975_06720, partial [Nitrospinae bacterium]|nr:hypothetical protein [Nitrospinota bacterium]
LMPAGSIGFVVGTTYHGAGHNTSGEDRVALTINYCNGRMRQQENLMLSIHPSRMLTFPKELQDILGFKVCQGAGHMLAQDPRAEMKRHTFVGIGWTRNSLEEPFRPIICAISNYEDLQGNISSRARDEFTNSIFILQESDTFAFLSTGQQLPAHLATDLARNVRRCVKRQCGPQPITRLLAIGIRRVAVDNIKVGDNLLAVSFPKSAVGSPVFLMVSGPPLRDMPSFLYIPAHQTDGIEYGPNVACRGWGTTGFRITPAGRR